METSLESHRDYVNIVAEVNVNLMKENLAGLTNPADISIQLVSQDHQPYPEIPEASDGYATSAEVKLVDRTTQVSNAAVIHDRQFPVVVPSFLLKFPQLGKDFHVGAIMVRNNNKEEFYLSTVKLKRVKNINEVPKDSDDWDWEFECDTQIHPTGDFRVFFPTRAVYFPGGLMSLKEKELKRLRGDGTPQPDGVGVFKFDVYNDLGFDFTLGNSELPYPRLLKKVSLFLPSSSGDSIVGHGDTLFQTFIHTAIQKVTDLAFVNSGVVDPNTKFSNILEVSSMENRFKTQTEALGVLDVLLQMLEMATFHKAPRIALLEKFIHVLKGILQAFDFPTPKSVKHVKPGVESSWSDVLMNDDEFGRQTLAGINPTVIQLLQ
ncbi:hypothetical protein Mapa_013716 [Marchantia paleacea]|nr:hypothetical protein Mapa_013716 [Marchantia paleacea]